MLGPGGVMLGPGGVMLGPRWGVMLGCVQDLAQRICWLSDWLSDSNVDHSRVMMLSYSVSSSVVSDSS